MRVRKLINPMYFKLFANCFPVRGAIRSVIYDLGRNDFKLIPNEMYEILTEHQQKTVEEIKQYYDNEQDETIDEYFAFLLEHEFGFYCTTEELELFPPMSTEFDFPSKISNAIIDTNSGSKHDYENIFTQLAQLQCRFIQLRFYDPVTYEFLTAVLQRTKNKGIKSLDLILPLTNEFTKEGIVKLFDFPVAKLEFHSIDEQTHNPDVLTYEYNDPVLFTREKVTSQVHCGVVDPAYFRVNKELFLESLKFNSCLHKKISVDTNGDIKNCPSMTKSYGNVQHTTLGAALEKKGFQEVWTMSKDKVNVCKYCEFRYMCTDCRAYLPDQYGKPDKCNYDPFTAKWG